MKIPVWAAWAVWFALGVTPWTEAAKVFASRQPQSEGAFGRAVAAVPDVEGDGIHDVIVGSDETPDRGPQKAGVVYVFDGYRTRRIRSIQSPNEQFQGRFGWSVAGLDDIDYDGRGDIAVGAYGEDPGDSPFMSGRVYVFSGGSGLIKEDDEDDGDGLGRSAAGNQKKLSPAELIYELVSPNEQYAGYFGWSVAAVPDLSGDGLNDLIVGAMGEAPDPALESAGMAYLFDGRSGQLLRVLQSPYPVTNGAFGSAVTGLADVDGDGRGDVAVAATGESPYAGLENAGMVYVFSGATGAMIRSYQSPNPEDNGFFGISLGNVTGLTRNASSSDQPWDEPVLIEPVSNLLVGASSEGNGQGRAYLFDGKGDGALQWALSSPRSQDGGAFGCSVAGVRDMTHDGVDEILVGAMGESTSATLKRDGAAYVFDGRTGQKIWTLFSPKQEPGGGFGFAVAGSYDHNNDPWGDPIVGAPGEGIEKGRFGAGRAYAFGRVLPQSQRAIVLPPVADQAADGYAKFGLSDYGPGVGYAVGYYYMTALEAAQRHWTAEDLTRPFRLRSPHFLLRNGGGGYMQFSMELLKGTGICSLEDFPTSDTETDDFAIEASSPFRILEYQAFFRHYGVINGIGEYIGDWDNPVDQLGEWLTTRGEGFVLGVPVFESFLLYDGGEYMVDPRRESVLGFQALFVIGYDPITGAFQFVNSWGTEWGEAGMGWLSGEFVRRYACEAWAMIDAQGWQPDRRIRPKGKRIRIASTPDYTITYKSSDPGDLFIDEWGILILDGGKDDTLKIKRRKGVPKGETIPSVVVGGHLVKFYTEAPIEFLEVDGRLSRVTAKNVTIDSIGGSRLARVAMTDSPNSTWQFLSHHLAGNPRDYYDDSEEWLNNRRQTMIEDYWIDEYDEDKGPPSKTTQIRLKGVGLGELIVARHLNLVIDTTRRRFYGDTFYSYGGIRPESEIQTVEKARSRIRVNGAAIEADSIEAGVVRSITARGRALPMELRAASNFRKTYDSYFPGHIRIATLETIGAMERLEARGGNMMVEDLTSERRIGVVRAKMSSYKIRAEARREYVGGFMGSPDEPVDFSTPARQVCQYEWGGDIERVHGDLGVYGTFSAARGASRVRHISTLGRNRVPDAFSEPTIVGEAWSLKPVRLTGGSVFQFVWHPFLSD